MSSMEMFLKNCLKSNKLDSSKTEEDNIQNVIISLIKDVFC